ncbi:hypothetical protein [Oceanicoccus sp. KOV_DT_Chl]|uniref:hypothetical protein n=1 Tax=Oceanicoccus sp. KOV_DT_Chl TaxID=1904639 RepID=UPI000C7BE5FB|nr:hypothetical protein [Oceanicoccus sp. KOV_DT_Chl]
MPATLDYGLTFMVINSSSTSIAQQLVDKNHSNKQQQSSARDLLERAKQVDQDSITEGVTETPLANREMPRPVNSIQQPQLLNNRTTMDSITERYKSNFEAMQAMGQNIDTRA